jgi:hypothetical protein
MGPRTVHCAPRGCGRRKKGKLYLVSEPGDGILPLWTPIDPPIEYEDKQFRGMKLVDLELILAGRPMSEYLVGASAKRMQREALLLPQIQAFGMPSRDRLRIGICATGGLEALSQLHPTNVRDFGYAIRALRTLDLGKAHVEVATSIRLLQDRDYSGTLASIWRLWNECPPSQKEKAAALVRLAMKSLGAPEDAMEVR